MSDSIKIAVIGGDGTGPEVTAEACKVCGMTDSFAKGMHAALFNGR